MATSPSQIREALYSTIFKEITGIIVISFAFMSPLPQWASILIALSVTFISISSSADHAHAEIMRDEGLKEEWFNQLTLRMAIDSMLDQLRSGQKPVIDWNSASKSAVADVKDSQETAKFKDDLSRSFLIDFLIYGVWAIIYIPLRGVVGYGIAKAFWAWKPEWALAVVYGL